MISNLDHQDLPALTPTTGHSSSAVSAEPLPARVLLFAVPASDLKEFTHDLPEKVRDEVNRTLLYLQFIHTAKSKMGACKHLAAEAQRHNLKGFSVESLRRKYYQYIASGDWHVLVNRAKAPEDRDKLPSDFLSFWRMLCENTKRVDAQAYRDLINLWQSHYYRNPISGVVEQIKSIPGYAEWPEADVHGEHPAGWSMANLYRHTPDEFDRKLGRQGRIAASVHRMKVYKTRVGLLVGEFYQFDDHEYDLKVNFPGQWKAMRPLGFAAVDVLSDCPFAKCFKQMLWDEQEEKKKMLTERDFMWFIVDVLMNVGYRTDARGTTLVVEWGTAAIRTAFEERIIRATNGHVKVIRSGKYYAEGGSRLTVSNQLRGQPRGNFRFKSLVEGLWNYVNNHIASLPGATGKDRDHAPEQLYGQDQWNNKLLNVMAALPVDRALQIKTPFMSWPEFLEAAMIAFHNIANTPDHELEGWEKMGFVQKEWRYSDKVDFLPYSQYLELSDAERTVAGALMQKNPALHRVRKLSRQQVFNLGRNQLTKLPAYLLPVLVGRENAIHKGRLIEPQSDGVFEFKIDELDSDKIRYVAKDADGKRLKGRFVCFVNPHNPSVLVACDDDLRVIAECNLAGKSCHNDVDGLRAQLGAQRSEEATAIREFDSRHATDIKTLADMRRHNAQVISGADEVRPGPELPPVEDCTDELLAREKESLE